MEKPYEMIEDCKNTAEYERYGSEGYYWKSSKVQEIDRVTNYREGNLSQWKITFSEIKHAVKYYDNLYRECEIHGEQLAELLT